MLILILIINKYTHTARQGSADIWHLLPETFTFACVKLVMFISAETSLLPPQETPVSSPPASWFCTLHMHPPEDLSLFVLFMLLSLFLLLQLLELLVLSRLLLPLEQTLLLPVEHLLLLVAAVVVVVVENVVVVFLSVHSVVSVSVMLILDSLSYLLNWTVSF